MRWFLLIVFIALTTMSFTMVLGQVTGQSIVDSPHNLSAAGPGHVRAASEQQICIFCHAPHHTSSTKPLWNRGSKAIVYKLYTSNSLDAQVDQPTGSSKLCLSCHDGTIALGNVASRDQPIMMAGGMTMLPPGASNLGTDLSDDHPISFRYDAALAAKDPKLRDPQTLPPGLKLDGNRELQCTTCHDPHDNGRGKFLTMNNDQSQLCNACHNVLETTVPNHQQCAGCHQPHTAPSGPMLLVGRTVTDTCVTCHGANQTGPQGPKVADDLLKASRHDTKPPITMTAADRSPNESTCIDCHGQHTMKREPTVAPLIPANFGKVPGLTAEGNSIAVSQYAYEVCFRCHNEQSQVRQFISRQVTPTSTRLEFISSAVSFHPVVAPGKNSDVPSLRTNLTTASQIYCHDCHSSDSGALAGGSGANGTHGSNTRPLLLKRYDTTEKTPESADAYALCYRCHDRAVILDETRSAFKLHKKHLDAQAACSACHDGHGIPGGQPGGGDHTHLINFNTSYVLPLGGVLKYEDRGMRAGTCTLTCHDKPHNAAQY